MKVVINDCILDSNLFRCCCINERLRLVYFIHRPKGLEGELSLPVLFDSLEETKRFFDGYCNALYDWLPEYRYTGEARFSHEFYIRIRDGINTSDKQ